VHLSLQFLGILARFGQLFFDVCGDFLDGILGISRTRDDHFSNDRKFVMTNGL